MGLINLLFRDPAAFVLLVIPLLYSIIIHEVAHGWVADKMGDSTARWMGRLTLDPRRHLDPVGTIMLFLFGFGWAKPVPVNFNNLRDYRKGLIFVSAAGITANILLAFLAQLIYVLWQPSIDGPVAMVSDSFLSNQRNAGIFQSHSHPPARRLQNPHGFFIEALPVLPGPNRTIRILCYPCTSLPPHS